MKPTTFAPQLPLPLIRIVRTPVVPFPRQVENTPISAGVLHRHLIPLAEEFGAHLQLCFTRDTREVLLHTLLTQMKAAKQRKHNARCSTTWSKARELGRWPGSFRNGRPSN